ncbi:hypothetical protein [Methylocaldum marinum]|uniref:hypothetical protein n=1 Tax=Methylocaldum marinum TaxID=1432792 RepID=UPI000E6A2AF9|nr:hypothetical protein [Methylocaldum marinum]
MPVPLKWKEQSGRLLRWDNNTPQLIAFLAPAPLFLIAGAILSYHFPVVSFAITLLYIFIVLPSFVMTASSPSAWHVPKALLHSFVLCWAVAGLFPIDDYLRPLLA